MLFHATSNNINKPILSLKNLSTSGEIRSIHVDVYTSSPTYVFVTFSAEITNQYFEPLFTAFNLKITG